MKPTFYKIIAILSICFMVGAMVLLCSCRQNMGALSWGEARNYLNRPDTMSRGVDYLGSDAEYHYFEHKREMASDVRFCISTAEDIYLPQETFPYRSMFPERRDAYAAIKGLRLTVYPDLSCRIEDTTYATPAAVPASLWAKVGSVYFCDKRYNEIRKMEQQLAPYLKSSPHVRHVYPLSGLPSHLLPK